MVLMDIGAPKWHLSLVAVPRFERKLTSHPMKVNDGEEVNYRWLWFALRVERYKKPPAIPIAQAKDAGRMICRTHGDLFFPGCPECEQGLHGHS